MPAVLTLVDSLASVPAEAWDALHDGTNPFVTHAFLSGLETTGCLPPRYGWAPRHALLHDGPRLIAAAPAWRKDNSRGEYVFDFAWAAACEEAGIAYYPKWLVGVPWSPVPGPRLMARDEPARQALAQALAAHTLAAGWSSLHVNFLPESEVCAFDPRWLARHELQFHWENPGWRDFADYLAAMTSRRRKAIRQERTKVAQAGYRFRIAHGDEASEEDLAAMHDFYRITFAQKGNVAVLTRGFFAHLARTMPRTLVLVLAERGGRTVAGALCLRGGDTLYGRYWGSVEDSPGLHFETCYYQGIEYCLREGLRRFEPGAQGEHKLARGFLPVLTHSRHLVTNPHLDAALRPWCAQEREGVRRYRDLLLEHSPFRHAPAAS